MTKTKPRIFFLANGGVGTGPFGEGVPAIQELVDALKGDYELTFFSLVPIHPDFVAHHFNLIAPRFHAPFLFRLCYILFRFSACFIRSRPRLLHCFWGHPSGIAGALIKRVFRVPLIMHLQGGDTVALPDIGYGELRSAFKTRLLRWAYAKADRIIVLSEFHKQKFLELNIARPVSVIPFGVNTQEFHPAAKRSDAMQLLWVASINRVKAPEVLLKAFVEIRKTFDATLTIIGSDVMKGQMQGMAEALGVSEYITYTGIIPRSEIVSYYQQSRVLLLTSWFESQALVVNEALACGLVVCSTRVGIAAQLAPEITLTVPPGDWQQLAIEVCRILSDEKEYEKRSELGIQWSRENDVRGAVKMVSRQWLVVSS